MWSLNADSYNNDAELSSGSKTVRVCFNKNIILQYVRTWLVLYNDPGLTSVTMKVYSDNNGAKGTLLHSSLTTHLKADLTTLNNCCKEVYFEFDNAAFDENNFYHFALVGVSSGFTDSSHLAWKTSYPLPVYTTGLTSANIMEFPYTFVAIGAEF